MTIELNTDRTILLDSCVPLSIETIRGKCRRISACQTPLSVTHPLNGKVKAHTLSISAITGIKKRASRSLSDTSVFTNVTSWALGLLLSVKIARIRKARDSAPLGKVRSSVNSFPCEEPSARMRGLMSTLVCSWTETSMCPYAANILSLVVWVNGLTWDKRTVLTHQGTRVP